jgi:hypothetical protein
MRFLLEGGVWGCMMIYAKWRHMCAKVLGFPILGDRTGATMLID